MESEFLRDIITTPILSTEPPTDKALCPKCESEIVQINAGIFIIEKCTKCDWRSRKT